MSTSDSSSTHWSNQEDVKAIFEDATTLTDKTTPEQLAPYIALDDWVRSLSGDKECPSIQCFVKLPSRLDPRRIQPYCRAPRKLHFGIAVDNETLIRCASRLDVPVPGSKGASRTKLLHSTIARPGYDIARALTSICNHRVQFRYAAGPDVSHVFALYSNYELHKPHPIDENEEIIVAIINRVLGLNKKPMWYYDGYSF